MPYYVRQGGRETLYNTQALAYKAAQKLANATGASVKVGVTSLARESSRTGRAVPRKASGKLAFKRNPAEKFKYRVIYDRGPPNGSPFKTLVEARKYCKLVNGSVVKTNPVGSDHSMSGLQALAGGISISPAEIWREIFGAKQKAKALIRKMTPKAKEAATEDGPYTVSWTDARGRKSTPADTRKEAEGVAKALRAIRVKNVSIA